MLKLLFPYIKLYRYYFARVCLGMMLVMVALSASIFLLSLSGWFLSATAFVGVAGLYTFNYMLPAAGVRGAAILRTVSRYFDRLVNHDTTFRILAYLRTMTFQKILPFSAQQMQQYQKAELLNRFIADIDNLDHLYLRLFVPVVTSLLMTLFIYLSISYFNQTIALMISLLLLITIITMPLVFYQAGKKLGIQIAEQRSHYRQQLINFLQGQAELTLFNAQQHYRAKLNTIEQDWLTNQKKQARLVSLSMALILLIVGLITLSIITLVANNIPDNHPPIIAIFIFTALSCAEILVPIPGAFIFLAQVLSSAQRMNDLLAEKPTITFKTKGAQTDLTQCQLNFTNVAFHYPNQPIEIFNAINLHISNGEHVALIGKTGCGKSSLLNLITRTWQPTAGQICLNQIDISEFDEPTLRNMISVIPQVIHIFNDTLRNNLLVGNSSASDEQLIAVLQKVELDKLINTGQGLNLWLGENGRNLSGGEKRRIGIARALLHDAPLILMDEPTESLDVQTEQQILSIIEKNYIDKTLIVVTHRLIKHKLFNRTLLLENTKLTEITASAC